MPSVRGGHTPTASARAVRPWTRSTPAVKGCRSSPRSTRCTRSPSRGWRRGAPGAVRASRFAPARRFTSSTSSHAAASMRVRGPGLLPAECTRPPMGPSSASDRLTRLSACSSWSRRPEAGDAYPVLLAAARGGATGAVPSRSQIATAARPGPARARWPIRWPEAPPVMRRPNQAPEAFPMGQAPARRAAPGAPPEPTWRARPDARCIRGRRVESATPARWVRSAKSAPFLSIVP